MAAGAYVPQFYRPHYDGPDGALLGVEAIHPAAPPFVQKQTYRGETLASSMVVSPRMVSALSEQPPRCTSIALLSCITQFEVSFAWAVSPTFAGMGEHLHGGGETS